MCLHLLGTNNWYHPSNDNEGECEDNSSQKSSSIVSVTINNNKTNLNRKTNHDNDDDAIKTLSQSPYGMTLFSCNNNEYNSGNFNRMYNNECDDSNFNRLSTSPIKNKDIHRTTNKMSATGLSFSTRFGIYLGHSISSRTHQLLLSCG